MTEHLSPSLLNALADGELSADQLAMANDHLAGCPTCTSSALYQSLLKAATAKAGQRYTPPPHLLERLTRSASQAESRSPGTRISIAESASPQPAKWFGVLGWVTAAVLLLVSASSLFLQRTARRVEVASAENVALFNEVFDQHMATLSGSLPPQVLSTDRHTVKPWFQGKLPFSFNLPERLPAGTTLDGANLAYLHNQSVAQLLYSIGKHRVSVFVRERSRATEGKELQTEHSGFHMIDFSTGDLEVVAVSDVDPARLAELVNLIRQVQTGGPEQSK
jgi:anti-sigma factor RsiW